MQNKGDGFHSLVELGIKADVIEGSDLSEEDYQPLYEHLSRVVNPALANPLVVNQSWQLQALSGNTDFYDKLDPQYVDNWGAGVSHYAAWSGKREALDWAKARGLDFLTAKDAFGRNIAHYAAGSGKSEALKWVKDNALDLLISSDDTGRNIAHYAASAGKCEALEWVKEHTLDLMRAEDTSGKNIAHYAARSGNAACFNRALHYSAMPKALYFKKIKKTAADEVLNCINQALDTNFGLTSITFPANLQGDERVQEILQKVSRNLAIPPAMKAFKALMLSEHHARRLKAPENQIELPAELWMCLLGKCLPPGVSEAGVSQLYNHACQAVDEAIAYESPLNKVKRNIKREIERLQSPSQRWLVTLGILTSPDEKIAALTALSKELDALEIQEEAVQKKVATDWLKSKKTVIEGQRNRLHRFFAPSHPAKTAYFVEALDTELQLGLGGFAAI